MSKIVYEFGSPLVKCSPFAQVIATDQKESFCDFCFKKIETEFKCVNCNYGFYCSSQCLNEDLAQHEIECRIGLYENVKNRLNAMLMRFEASSQQYDALSIFHHFTLNEMIDYTVLCFRILILSKNNPESFFNNCNWTNLRSSDNIHQCSSKRRRTDLFYYTDNFDSLSKDEINELDRLLEIDMPDDDYFRKLYQENIIKQVLSNIIDNVANSFDIEVPESVDGCLEQNPNDEEPVSSIKDAINLFEHHKIGYDEFRRLMSDHMSKLRQRPIQTKQQDFPVSNSQKSVDSEDYYDELFDWSQSSNPNGNVNDNAYKSIYLDFHRSINEKNEDEAIEQMKKRCRQMYLEMYNNQSRANETEIDLYFGRWIHEILRCFNQVDLLNYFKADDYDYDAIEKAFFIAMRYSIAITDELNILPIGRAVYLPLTKMEHSCLPNTSLVFENNCLNVFYLPKNKLQITQKMLLNLNEVTVDFSHEKTNRKSIDTYKFNKIRLMQCQCARCKQSKNQISKEFQQLFNEQEVVVKVHGGQIEDEFSALPDSEFFNDLNFTSNQYQTSNIKRINNVDDVIMEDIDLDQYHNNRNRTQTSNEIDYDSCFERLNFANDRYGNRSDEEYSKMIQDLLIESIFQFRNVLGYYHKYNSILLLFVHFCNFTIMKYQKDKIDIICRCLHLHGYTIELMHSVVITHGSNYRWVKILRNVHQMFDELLNNLYCQYEQDVNQFFREIGKSALVVQLEKFKQTGNCSSELCLTTEDFDRIPEHLKHRTKDQNQNVEHIDNVYIPFMPTFHNYYDDDDDEQMKFDDDHVNNNNDEDNFQNQLNKILETLSEISNYRSFRFLFL